jgi:SAM-dependent methyltransferase
LCSSYFSRLIRPTDSVLELGAGYCHFINNIQAKERFAVDLWPEVTRCAVAPVKAHVGSVSDLGFLPSGSIDVVFASNLFEHLSQQELASTLKEVKRTLKPSGSIVIVQPNFRYAYREYFDDYTHVAMYSHVSLSDFLRANDFQVVECQPKFLPLTVKSRFPIHPLLIQLYLWFPIKPLGRQMLIRAVPAK